GLCERSQNLAYYVGQDTNALGESKKKEKKLCFNEAGWAYYGCNGYLYHASGSKAYGSKLKQGDVLSVEVDMDSGALSFSKNGSSFGVAYPSGLEGKEIFPAVSLYDIGDSVTFIDTKKKEGTKVCRLFIFFIPP